MVRIDAALGVMRLLPVGTPARLVSEHVKCKSFQGLVNRVQILVQSWRLQKTVYYHVIFDSLVLGCLIELVYELQLLHAEAH